MCLVVHQHIDLIFVSSITFVQFCSTIPSLGNADHYGLHLIFKTTAPKMCVKAIKRKVWRYSLADWDQASELLTVLTGTRCFLRMLMLIGQHGPITTCK